MSMPCSTNHSAPMQKSEHSFKYCWCGCYVHVAPQTVAADTLSDLTKAWCTSQAHRPEMAARLLPALRQAPATGAPLDIGIGRARPWLAGCRSTEEYLSSSSICAVKS